MPDWAESCRLSQRNAYDRRPWKIVCWTMRKSAWTIIISFSLITAFDFGCVLRFQFQFLFHPFLFSSVSNIVSSFSTICFLSAILLNFRTLDRIGVRSTLLIATSLIDVKAIKGIKHMIMNKLALVLFSSLVIFPIALAMC